MAAQQTGKSLGVFFNAPLSSKSKTVSRMLTHASGCRYFFACHMIHAALPKARVKPVKLEIRPENCSFLAFLCFHCIWVQGWAVLESRINVRLHLKLDIARIQDLDESRANAPNKILNSGKMWVHTQHLQTTAGE